MLGPANSTHARLEVAGLAIVLALAIAAYWPGLSGPFIFDDFGNIVRNYFLRIDALTWEQMRDAAFSSRSGPLGRPIAMLSFALNYYFNDQSLSPFAFKVANVCIHCACAVFLFLLMRKLVQLRPGALSPKVATAVPILATAVWVLHPLQLTTVLYVVQRMNGLCVLFCVLGLWLFVVGRIKVQEATSRRSVSAGFALMVAGVVGGTVLGLGAKENAAVLPFLALCIELWFFSTAALSRGWRRCIWGFYAVVAIGPLCGAVALLVYFPEIITTSYEGRDFSILERLLTQARVLFFYLALWVYPNVRHYNLFHDDFLVSRGVVDPVSTVLALLAWAIVIGVVFARWRSKPIWAFGVAWYLIAHGVESSVIGLELVFEHRNYLPSMGLAFVGAYYIVHWMRSIPRFAGAVALASALVAVLAMSTHARAGIWSDSKTLSYFLARNNPEGIRARSAFAFAQLRDGSTLDDALRSFGQISVLDERAVGPLIEMVKILAGYVSQKLPTADFVPLASETVLPLDALELVNDATKMRQALWHIDQALNARLEGHAIGADAMGSLRELQQCVRAGYDVCAPLAVLARNWHRRALGNTRAEPIVLARIAFSLAHLEFHAGNGQEAVSLMSKARLQDPADISFSIELSRLHVALREFEAADVLLTQLEADVPKGAFRAREVTAARQYWTDERAASVSLSTKNTSDNSRN
ncbi:MAG: tetratricopeptide repeat protein [Gammaproteobacteria bacterium]|nr:tetratricopeptide repeat protein [Gammaproteobacteria bacterium]